MIQKLKKAAAKLTIKSITANIDLDELDTLKKNELDTQNLFKLIS